MLQQTQVVTVIPYYNRWMEKFPTIGDLARATIEEVNAVWKGLGYYSRARRLLEGAQKAVNDLDGKLPDNAKDMEAKIPGIGRYSAGAICSIAYGEEAPVLDGNVHRLLSRFLALHCPPKAKPTLDILWAAAKALVETRGSASTRLQGSPQLATSSSGTLMDQHAGDINQALIELGSTVCKVREPSCASCPIKPWCAAYKQSQNPGSPQRLPDIEDACDVCEPIPDYGGVVSYPMKADRKKPREELDIVNVIEWRRSPSSKDRHFLFVKRPEGGLLAGLYEFPTNSNVSKGLTPSAKETLGKELIANLIQDGGIFPPPATLATKIDVEADTAQSNRMTIVKVVSVGDVIHVFSHIKKTYSVQWLVLEGGICPPELTFRPGAHGNPHKGRARKGKDRDAQVSGQSSQGVVSPEAMWTHLDDVQSINMGTGVVKVWNLTKALWEP